MVPKEDEPDWSLNTMLFAANVVGNEAGVNDWGNCRLTIDCFADSSGTQSAHTPTINPTHPTKPPNHTNVLFFFKHMAVHPVCVWVQKQGEVRFMGRGLVNVVVLMVSHTIYCMSLSQAYRAPSQ